LNAKFVRENFIILKKRVLIVGNNPERLKIYSTKLIDGSFGVWERSNSDMIEVVDEIWGCNQVYWERGHYEGLHEVFAQDIEMAERILADAKQIPELFKGLCIVISRRTWDNSKEFENTCEAYLENLIWEDADTSWDSGALLIRRALSAPDNEVFWYGFGTGATNENAHVYRGDVSTEGCHIMSRVWEELWEWIREVPSRAERIRRLVVE